MALTISLLGAPSVLRDGVPLPLPTRKTTALLAYLAISGASHSRDALDALLWPEADRTHARGALRYTLGQLRSALGAAWLVTTRDQVALATGDDLTVDVSQVDALMTQVRAHGHALRTPCPTCAPLLSAAIALQRGPLLSGFSLPDSPAFDDWLLFETERLQQLHADALRGLIDGYRAAGTPVEAIPYARRWLVLDPFADDANRVLIELLIASGQRSAARRHYDTHAALLRDELDVAPPSETTALIARLGDPQRVDAASASAAAPTIVPVSAPLDHVPRPLPTPATPLVGRAHEVAALARLLDDPSCRLLTLLGPGGSGKTRLALAVAHARQSGAVASVVWVALAGLGTADALAATIAEALGCPLATGDDPEQRLVDYLRPRQHLLILDNIEQLLHRDDPAGAAGLVERILAAATGVQVLLTSRVRVHLHTEQLYPVQGLDFPDWDEVSAASTYGAVQLFVACAQRVQPDFVLSAMNAPAVTRIIRLLAGQPLAIELAAAWVGALTPADIAAELVRGIDLLATDARNVPPRHRSMRASYGLSWQQLGAREQALQQALSVFHGGFSRAAAEQIAGATPQALRTLVDHSLLAASSRASSSRYEVHELLRQFAAEQLAQVPQVQAALAARHAAYYVGWLVEQMEHPPSPSRTERLAIDEENVRAAWLWAAQQHDLALLSAAIDPLCGVFQQHGRTTEGMALCEPVIAALEREPNDAAHARLLGQALTWKATFAIASGQLDAARDLLQRSLALLTDAPPGAALAFALRTRGHLELLSGDLANAAVWLERGLAGYQDSGDRRGMVWTLDALGRTAWLAGDYRVAREHAAASLAHYQALDDRVGTAHALADLALATVFGGDVATGLALVAESQRVADDAGDQIESLRVQRHVAATLYNLGRYQDALPLLVACVASDDRLGNRLDAVEDRSYLATTQLIERQYQHAIETAAAVLADSRALGSERSIGYALALRGLAELGDGALLAARQQLNASLVAAPASHLGDDPIMAHWGLCQVARKLGDATRAREHAHISLELAANGRGARAACLALSALAGVLVDEGAVERAIELAAVVLAHSSIQQAGFFLDYTVVPVAAWREQVAAERVQAARQRGQAREPVTTVREELAIERARAG